LCEYSINFLGNPSIFRIYKYGNHTHRQNKKQPKPIFANTLSMLTLIFPKMVLKEKVYTKLPDIFKYRPGKHVPQLHMNANLLQ